METYRELNIVELSQVRTQAMQCLEQITTLQEKILAEEGYLQSLVQQYGTDILHVERS